MKGAVKARGEEREGRGTMSIQGPPLPAVLPPRPHTLVWASVQKRHLGWDPHPRGAGAGPWKSLASCSFSTDGKVEAQRGEVTCPRLHRICGRAGIRSHTFCFPGQCFVHPG